MKQIISILFIIIFTVSLNAQFNGGSFNNIVNLGLESSLELLPGNKMSDEDKKVDDLFGKVFGSMGVDAKSNENPLIHLANYKGKELQTWKITLIAENEFVVFNEHLKLALTLENDGKAEKAKIIPMPYKEGSANQVFNIVRDENTARYGFSFISKISGMAITADEKSKELYQMPKVDGNKFQIWYMSNRNTFRNISESRYLSLNTNEALFSKAQVVLTPKKNIMTSNWDFIAHPTSTGVYYIMNSFSKKFISLPKNQEGEIIEGAKIVQTNYDVSFNLLFHFILTQDKKAYLIYAYPGNEILVSDVDGTFLTAKPDPEKTNQGWILLQSSASLF